MFVNSRTRTLITIYTAAIFVTDKNGGHVLNEQSL